MVCQGWPLSKFVCPSYLGSFYEVKTLFFTFKNDAAKFVKLDAAQMDAWLEVRAHGAQTHSNPDEPVAEGPVATPPAVAAAESITTNNNNPLPAPKKKRKPRSDIGKRRGPRKGKESDVAVV